MTYTVTLIPGDGIGPELAEATRGVLEATGIGFAWDVQEAGADVLYAPGLSSLDDIRSVVSSVDRPVNVLAIPGAPTVSELASAGVKRISVGGAFMYVAFGALAEAARELLERGTYDFWSTAMQGAGVAAGAFTG